MAQIYDLPEEIGSMLPDLTNMEISIDWDSLEETEKKVLDKAKQWVKENTDSKSPLVGEEFGIPMADGYARYLVFRTKPLVLFHLPFGDAYDAPDYMTRGIRCSDVKQYVQSRKALKSIFA